MSLNFSGFSIITGLKIALSKHRLPSLDHVGWNPLLVVCYTNHTLDPFLEGNAALGEEHKSPCLKLKKRPDWYRVYGAGVLLCPYARFSVPAPFLHWGFAKHPPISGFSV